MRTESAIPAMIEAITLMMNIIRVASFTFFIFSYVQITS